MPSLLAAMLGCTVAGGHTPMHRAYPEGLNSLVISLDGTWQLGIDPENAGREAGWWEGPTGDVRPAKVPWIIQDAFPAYHGVAWYWREFEAPANPYAGGRTLLRFWAVDYLADVWLNDTHVGGHEGGETPFVLDVTPVIRTDGPNKLAVRVLNPTNEPIDGYVLRETPGRNRVIPYGAGSAFAQGGITDSVELLQVPAVWIEDLFLRPDTHTGTIDAQVQIRNSAATPAEVELDIACAPGSSGEAVATLDDSIEVPAGLTTIHRGLRVPNPRLWDIQDPNLYRVTARLRLTDGATYERSARCGFREFVFENGAFRLNGKRLYLKCSHTGNCAPVGLQFPPDMDMLRRDLLNVKVMGFNAIRFIAGVATRYQLDLCDEIGLMVYEEHYGSWCLADSPKMKERYDRSLREMILRDRNHPSITIWGLLNETPDGAVFRNAVADLPLVRSLDDTRMVMLNSGSWAGAGRAAMAGLEVRRRAERTDPCVTRNGTTHVIQGLGITWQPGQLALHPGEGGEYGTLRWISPIDGEVEVEAVFSTIAERATTDVHVLHAGEVVWDGLINVGPGGPRAEYRGTLSVRKGDFLDFPVGYGNGNYGADTTALALTIRAGGKVFDAATDYVAEGEQTAPWDYGWLAAGERPDSSTFQRFPVAETLTAEGQFGPLSNPGSSEWEDTMADQHPYQHVPHTLSVIHTLRTFGQGGKPMFISEYGVGSAVDLVRAARHYERLGKTDVEDAVFYRDKLDRFMVDWDQWKLSECFARPDDFFLESQRQMSRHRLYGLNAIRANPTVIGHSLTGTVDQGMTGEGLFTTFRELKPETIDALFDAWAPLRLCLFAEPRTVYRGGKIRLEAVLANEDALRPGEYPIHLSVVGPDMSRPLVRTVTVRIPEGQELPFAIPVFAEDLRIDGPAGKYRFVASMGQGGAAAGGDINFRVFDPADMPAIERPVVLASDDPPVAEWLTSHGIEHRPLGGADLTAPQVILVTASVAGGAEGWQAVQRAIEAGSTAVFLCAEAFREGDDPVRWMPLSPKGAVVGLASWLYHKDEWAKAHPIFEGLPAGGLMDYEVYAELIPDVGFNGQPLPTEAVAGGCNASQDYSSGLFVAVYPLGKGRVILNSLRVRETLGGEPVAERLLRNMLRYAAGKTGE